MNNNVNIPNHIAIILDGNGRWAERNGHTRNYGHKRGCEALVKICKHARKINLKYLTVFAFSTENWKRPKKEVDYLMSLIHLYLDKHINDLKKNNVKVNILGERNNLPNDIKSLIEKCESETKNGDGLTLNICFNYGSHTEIVNACKRICSDYSKGLVTLDNMNNELFEKYLYTKNMPLVDLLIRTSGEMRISNFLLWQIAYSELYFTNLCFPEFTEKDLDEAIIEYNKRNRRFGGLK